MTDHEAEVRRLLMEGLGVENIAIELSEPGAEITADDIRAVVTSLRAKGQLPFKTKPPHHKGHGGENKSGEDGMDHPRKTPERQDE